MTNTRIVRTIGIVATGALLLAAIAAPSAAFATPLRPGDPVMVETAAEELPTDEAPTGDVEPTPGPTDHEDNIVYDGPFITPTPDPTPAGRVKGAIGAPALTPPATDAAGVAPASAPGTGIGLLLLAVAGLSTVMLVLGRRPAARRC